MTSFTYGSTNLSTLGNVVMIDDYLDLPEKRGSNKVIPYRHGTVFNQKFYDERTLTFGLAVLGTSLTDLESKLNTIRGLFSEQTQQTLTIVYGDATTKTALVTVDKPLQIARIQSLARIVIEFTMCEPFFRLSTVIADNTTVINANPKAMTVTNPGTIEERDPVIILSGPLTNTVITNSTNGVVLTYTGAINDPRIVTIQTTNGEYVATDDLGANKIGNVTHSGSAALMTFDVGGNTLSIADGVASTGTVKISFYAPFI